MKLVLSSLMIFFGTLLAAALVAVAHPVRGLVPGETLSFASPRHAVHAADWQALLVLFSPRSR